MKRIALLVSFATACSGGVHLYEKTGSYTGAAFQKQAARREVAPVRALSGTDIQIIAQNYVAAFAHGGASASAGTAGPAAAGAGAAAGMAAEGPGIVETVPQGGRER